jgi:hypothetical protein
MLTHVPARALRSILAPEYMSDAIKIRIYFCGRGWQSRTFRPPYNKDGIYDWWRSGGGCAKRLTVLVDGRWYAHSANNAELRRWVEEIGYDSRTAS